MHRCLALAPDEVDAGDDVAPLVRATDLEYAALVVMQPEVVVRLEQHVAELGEADPVLGVDAHLHALASEHLVDGDVLADVAQEFEHRDRLGPVTIVDEHASLRIGQIDDSTELFFDTGDVVVQHLVVEEIAFLGLAARVADHAGRATGQSDRPMPRILEPPQHHQPDQVAHMQTVRRGVTPVVDADGPFRDLRPEVLPVRRVVDQATCLEVCDEISVNQLRIERHMASDSSVRVVRDPWNDSELVQKIRAHERDSFTRAPLNSALCHAIARDRSLHTLLAHAPLEQQLPVLLLASIHFLVLAEPEHELAGWYPNITPDPRDSADPALDAVLHDFVNDRGPSMLDLLATRNVQTNEIGRCSFLLPAFASICDESGSLGHVDVGTSAGLTTLLPRFSYRYDDGPLIGDGRPQLDCSTRGERTLPTAVPKVASARGIDLDPIDVTDADDARWLQACCWPDQTDRFERLATAIELAAADPPTIVSGDAVEAIRPTIDDVPVDHHPVVTSTWAMNYLRPDARGAFVDELDAVGAERDISYVFAESPSLTPELPHAPELCDEFTTALTILRWRSGERTMEHLGTAHPHGYWIHWR